MIPDSGDAFIFFPDLDDEKNARWVKYSAAYLIMAAVWLCVWGGGMWLTINNQWTIAKHSTKGVKLWFQDDIKKKLCPEWLRGQETESV